MDLRVKHISEDQLEDFCSILKEAVMWLQSQGQEMWNIEQVSKEKMLEQYAVDNMYLGYMGGIPAATMVLQDADDVFWPSAAEHESLFLHKLSVRRKFAKSGLAKEMVIWAKNEAENQNKKYLRLDCAADRPGLCSFYESLGFRKVREQVMFNRYLTAFYELDV